MSPYPTAFTYLNGQILKIFAAEINREVVNFSQAQFNNTENSSSKTQILSDNKSILSFKCADKWLNVLELQLEGKKRMRTEEFLKGFKF